MSPSKRPMWLRIALAAVLATGLAGGCSKSKPSTSVKSAAPSTNALWALAPADTVVGVVIADGTGPMLDAAIATLKSAAERRLGAQVGELLAEIPPELRGPLFSPDERKKLGLDTSRGAALFVVGEGEEAVAVVPVIDRNAVRALIGARTETIDGQPTDVNEKTWCRDISGHYVCTSKLELLATVGKSDAMAKQIAARPASMRGHVEVLVEGALLASERESLQAVMQDVSGIHAVLALEPGGFTARGHMAGTPSEMARQTIGEVGPLAQRAAKARPAGLTRLQLPLGLIMPVIAAKMTDELGPLLASVIDVKAAILDNITGEIIIVPVKGGMAIQIGMRDSGKLLPLLGMACKQAAAMLPTVKHDGNRCSGSIDPALLGKDMPFDEPISVAVSLDEGAMVAEIGIPMLFGNDVSGGVDPSAAGRELMSGDWSVAMWGHGLVLRDTQMAQLMKLTGEDTDRVKHKLWASPATG